jgi:hypothetical protein
MNNQVLVDRELLERAIDRLAKAQIFGLCDQLRPLLATPAPIPDDREWVMRRADDSLNRALSAQKTADEANERALRVLEACTGRDSRIVSALQPRAMVVPAVDDLSNFIRGIDGSNKMGAGDLAERICDWLAAAPAPKGDSQ